MEQLRDQIRRLKWGIYRLSVNRDEHASKATLEIRAGRSGSLAHRTEEYYAELNDRFVRDLKRLLADSQSRLA